MRNRNAVLVLALLLLPASARAQAGDTARIPADPQVISGTLPNGMRYYVRENHRPEKRAQLELAVNAGSVLEDDDQQGLAHFTEHMAFNGTKHFEKNELIDYMRSIGMRFGAELNAYTSDDETVYFLVVPTDTGTALARGLDVLSDWAAGQLMDTTEIRKERGVVLEEWRLSRGASMRMRDQQRPILYAGSRYAERNTIGTREGILGFAPAALVRFYRDWYRPDLQAVVAVGDFDGRKIEAMIKERFGAIPAPISPRPRPRFPVPPGDSTRYAIATDREATGTMLSLSWRIPVDSVRTEADARREMVQALYTSMLSTRLAELTQKPNPPFIFAYAYVYEQVRGMNTFALASSVKQGDEVRALDALLTEAERARRHGFTPGELSRQKAQMLRQLEQAYAERDRTESGRYAGQYVRDFLRGAPSPSIEYTLALTRRLLPGITLDEVNALSQRFLGSADRRVALSAPEKPDMPVATPAQLAAVLPAVRDRAIEPYRDELANAPLVPALPRPAAIVAERALPEVGAREIRLGNGVRIVLKPTDFKADEIVFQGYWWGGSSVLGARDARATGFVAQLALSGGLGRFSQVELSKALAGKVAGVTTYLGETTQGLQGRAAPRDLETALQLTYLSLTSPRVDSGAFLALKQRMRAAYQNRGAMPEQVFSDTLGAVLAQYSPRRMPITPEAIDSLQYADMLRIYRERFADPGALTFIMVGSFTVDSVKPLLVKYLGALPSLGRRERPADVLPETPTGVEKRVVRKGMEQKSGVALVFSGPIEYGPETNARLQQLASLLSDKLILVVREELSGTYGIGAYANAVRLPRPRYQLRISFGCAPDRVEELTGRVFAELDKIKSAGPDTADVRKTREELRRSREVSLKENRWWLGQLYNASLSDWSFAQIPAEAALVESMSAATIQESARKLLDNRRYVQVVLMPGPVSLH